MSPIISPKNLTNVKLLKPIIYKPIISIVKDKQILSLIRLSLSSTIDNNHLMIEYTANIINKYNIKSIIPLTRFPIYAEGSVPKFDGLLNIGLNRE